MTSAGLGHIAERDAAGGGHYAADGKTGTGDQKQKQKKQTEATRRRKTRRCLAMVLIPLMKMKMGDNSMALRTEHRRRLDARSTAVYESLRWITADLNVRHLFFRDWHNAGSQGRSAAGLSRLQTFVLPVPAPPLAHPLPFVLAVPVANGVARGRMWVEIFDAEGKMVGSSGGLGSHRREEEKRPVELDLARGENVHFTALRDWARGLAVAGWLDNSSTGGS
ncbi:hypothetical protein DFH06DRAFT_1118290 [Mycena polygramma]|nr:hypothetical protein DFH06DRAFT_1118290 [Mycena polygramma]